jgi:uncharacterized OsmC-like protein
MQTATLYRVHARTTSPSVSAATVGDQTVRFDTSPGRTGDLPGPAELLAMAFAACVLKNVQRFAEILPFECGRASIEVVAERQESPPRFSSLRYTLRIETDETDRRLELLHRNIARHGTVYNTLAAACDVSGEVLREQRRQDPARP